MKTAKTTVTATFPGIGKVEIPKERAQQILRLQKMIREQKPSFDFAQDDKTANQ